jgi:hypothetical protein
MAMALLLQTMKMDDQKAALNAAREVTIFAAGVDYRTICFTIPLINDHCRGVQWVPPAHMYLLVVGSLCLVPSCTTLIDLLTPSKRTRTGQG